MTLSSIEQWVVQYLSKKPEKGASMAKVLSAFELAGQDMLQSAVQRLVDEEGLLMFAPGRGRAGLYVGLRHTETATPQTVDTGAQKQAQVPLTRKMLKGLLPVPVLERLQSPSWRKLALDFQQEIAPYKTVPLLKRIGVPTSVVSTLAWCTEERLKEYLAAVRALTPQDLKRLPRKGTKKRVGGLLSTADSAEPNQKFKILASLASARVLAEAFGVLRETIARAYRVAHKGGRQTVYVVELLQAFEEQHGQVVPGFVPPPCLLPRPVGPKSRERYAELQRAYDVLPNTADRVEWSSLRHNQPKEN